VKFKYQKLPIGGYDSRKPLIPRPYIPVYLIGKNQRTGSPYYALLDSGADRVIFPRDLALEVGIKNFKSDGRHEPSIGIGNQTVDVYYHNLKLQILGDTKELNTEVGFAESMAFPILGRSFFKHFKSVVFNESKEEVELKV